MRLQLRTSLRGKTLLIILVTLAGLVVGLGALSRVVLLRGFSSLEDDFARQNLQQAFSGISNELDSLDHTTAQYASRDQTYEDVRERNPERLAAGFPDSTLEQLRVNFVAVRDSKGLPLFSMGFNLAAMEPAPFPADLEADLRPGSPLLAHQGQTDDVKGMLMLASGPILVVSSPVTASNSKAPPAGTLILGRSLDAAEIERLGNITRLPIEFERLDAGSPQPDFRAVASAITASDSVLIRPAGPDSLAAYQALRDVYGKPVALVRVLLPRKIYDQGQTSLVQFLLLLLASGFVFGAVTLFLLERFVLSRVAELSEKITEIGTSGDLAARLPISGKDEIAYLGTAVNGMLEDLGKAQIERHQERTRLGVMVETMPAVLWTANAELKITSAMGAGLHAVGLGSRESVGLTLLDFFRTRDPEFPAIAAHRRALDGESVAFETVWETRRFESHVQPLRNGEGSIEGVIGVALDVTERERLADQLRQSQKMQAVGELAGGVAHDFNNLLMVVKGHAQLLLDRVPDPSPMRQSVLQVEKAADRAASLTRQLLAFSRKQVLQPRVLDMNEVVGGMIRMFSRVIGENIEMAFLPGSGLGRVKADPGQVEQVLLNLVVNARDAMPDGGRLTIETSNVDLDRGYSAKHANAEPGPYVMLTVTDTGRGMSAETQSHIFEPFFTTKGPGKGTGLGLATVYGVVKQSGGYIWVYSEVGHGTTFKIYLPRVMSEIERLAPETDTKNLAKGSETILFVEDEQSVRELVRGYLCDSGYTVLEAPDGTEALKVASAHDGTIHMLITDVVMPHLSGPELAAQIGALRPELKVLFVSGYTDDTVFRHGVLEGGVAYLQKPFNLKALAHKIREVLSGQPVAAIPRAGMEDN
jgi:signal transduction histidine kinase/sensor domain CHASE-containing protein/CheY-like chemotaxis protein